MRLSRFMLICIIILTACQISQGQNDSLRQADSPEFTGKSYPVTFQRDTLFFIYADLGPFTAEERAVSATERLRTLRRHHDVDSFSIVPQGGLIKLKYKDLVFLSITEEDALAVGRKQDELATEYMAIVKTTLVKDAQINNWKYVTLNVVFFTLGILGLFLGIYVIAKAFKWFVHKLSTRKVPEEFSSRLFNFISPQRARQYWTSLLNILKFAVIIIFLFLYIPILFNFLPWTVGLAEKVYGYILNPVKLVLFSFINFIPDLFFIVVIAVITYYVLKFLRYLASEIERERIVISGFYSDWAIPTFKLVQIFILIFAFVVVFPYLPGSDSPAFKGISIFLGVLFSLGSTSAVANIVAGIVITYMRPFSIGDRVKIGETIGDVIEKNFLLTRVRTIKNEAITIPNAEILQNHLVNYSRNAEDLGLVLHTSVTIGYDIPWKEVHTLLMGAASDCKHVLDEPSPFVLQRNLGDFYIEYELKAYTREPKFMAFTYSELHKCILNRFAKAGVEIMSPHYRAMRDGNKSTVPEDFIVDDDNNLKRTNENS